MSATIVGNKNQTTLPADVLAAAGIRPNDQVDWRFEAGEIRGRKVDSEKDEPPTRKLVKIDGRYFVTPPLGREEILARIRADREGK